MKLEPSNLISEIVKLLIDFKISEYEIYNKSNSMAETKNLIKELTFKLKDDLKQLIDIEIWE